MDAEHGHCLAQFQAIIKSMEGRWTVERTQLLDTVCSIDGHFRMDELMELLTRRGAKVSQTTVYRSLPLLERAGVICRPVHLQPGIRESAVYEHIDEATHHDHLVCSRCGKTVEFEYPAIEVLQEAVAQEHGFVLQRHHLELVGVCAECQVEHGTE
jgi:Fur family ferric uptake transcriptional regulator